MPRRFDSSYGSQFIRAFTTRDDDWTREAPGTFIPFTASTGATAKDKMALKPERWKVDNYHRSGGPVLWQHDHSRPAIGNGTAAIEPKRLRIHAVFDQEDEFARSIESKLRRRVLRSSSVGWCFVDGAGEVLPNQRISPYVIENQAYQSLDEMSIVNVGSDPFAVAERAAATRYALQQVSPRFVDIYDAMERTDSDVTEPELREALIDYCRHIGLEFNLTRGAGYEKPEDDEDEETEDGGESTEDTDTDAETDAETDDEDDGGESKAKRSVRAGRDRGHRLPERQRSAESGSAATVTTLSTPSVDTSAAKTLIDAFGGLGR